MSRAELQVGPVLGAGSARAHECLGGGGSSGPGAGPARGGPSGGGRAEAAAGRGARGTAAERASELDAGAAAAGRRARLGPRPCCRDVTRAEGQGSVGAAGRGGR